MTLMIYNKEIIIEFMYQPNIFKKAFHQSRRLLARKWFTYVKPFTIGITGSMGKTTTANILASLYKEAVITDINLDTYYNIPITVLKLKKSTKVVILEYGIDQVDEMDAHLEIAKPDVVIITGITAVHTDAEHLGSLENLIKEKRKLVECLESKDIAILNYDDVNVREMAKHTKAKVIFYGSVKENCDIVYDEAATKITVDGTYFSIIDNEEGQLIELQTKLIGSQFVYNLMSAYAAYKYHQKLQGQTLDKIIHAFQEGVKAVEVLKGRMSFEKVADYYILNDSLRSNPLSVVNGLVTFKLLKLAGQKRKVVILGEMGELGDSGLMEHEKVGRLIANLDAFDMFIGIGPLQKIAISEAIANGFASEKTYYADNALVAGEFLKTYLHEADAIYLKGSLLRHMERILMLLNNEEVKCSVVSCPFYNNCRVCKYRHSVYAP